MFRSIVVGFDDTLHARHGLALVESLARICTADVTAADVHLFHPIRQAAAVAALNRVGAVAVSPDGDAATALSSLSRDHDLLVLGSRSYGPPSKRLPQLLTAAVAQRATSVDVASGPQVRTRCVASPTVACANAGVRQLPW